jgi:hypothetical protein
MQAHQYPKMMEWISSGKMHPEKLLGKIITLEEGCEALTDLNSFRHTGVTVIGLTDYCYAEPGILCGKMYCQRIIRNSY